MKIWITGIAGFLGSHLKDELIIAGHVVDGNDNMLCPSSDMDSSKVVDCREYREMRYRLDFFKPDVLIHCAATAHEGLSNFSPSFVTQNIYEASVATFSAAIASGVKRIIFMSSMARYGAQCPPFHEDMSPVPVDPYGIAKVAAEKTLTVLCKLHDVEHVIAVPHNIIGPRQRYCDPYRNVASIMINRALQNKPIIIYGDGKQKRCFSPVRDCLDSLVKMIDAPISGKTINIGPDEGEITILELAEIIRDLTNPVEFKFVTVRPNEVKEAYCSSSKARSLLGFSPKQSITDCLSEMIEFIRKEGTKAFKYDFPIEIMTDATPKTWTEKLI